MVMVMMRMLLFFEKFYFDDSDDLSSGKSNEMKIMISLMVNRAWLKVNSSFITYHDDDDN